MHGRCRSSQSPRWSVWLVALLLLTAAACAAPLPDPNDNGQAPSEREMILYFPDRQVLQPVPERRVKSGDTRVTAEMVVTELLAGPQDPYLEPAFPEGTELQRAVVADGLASINLTAEALALDGSASEQLAVTSLVYSVTELPSVDQVQILVEGQPRQTLGNHVDISDPIPRGPIALEAIALDEERAAWLQSEADEGRQQWRLDPDSVVRIDSRMFGFTDQATFQLLEASDGSTVYEVSENETAFRLTLEQPVSPGDDGIWMLTAGAAID